MARFSGLIDGELFTVGAFDGGGWFFVGHTVSRCVYRSRTSEPWWSSLIIATPCQRGQKLVKGVSKTINNTDTLAPILMGYVIVICLHLM